MNVRRRNQIQKWLRDYMVPIIWAFLIILLLFSLFSGGDDTKQIDLENKVWMSITMNWASSEAYIVYPGNNKVKIEWDISLYKWEEIIVKEWNVSLNLLWLWDLRLSKLWDLKYLENGNFSLLNSDLWLNSTDAVNVAMKFATVNVWANSNISFSQNEVESSVYLLSGSAEVFNIAWESTVLWAGQKITIPRLDANKKVDLSLNKTNLDDYDKQSEWFILNNWASYLTNDSEIETQSGSLDTSSWTTDSTNKIIWSNHSNVITFANLIDESNVSSSSISISWNYFDDNVTSISVNWKEAVLNTNLKTFKFENVAVPEKENDLVFKVMDDANDTLAKFVYTIYYAWGTTASTNSSSSSGWGNFKVQTYNVDGTQFTFTEPTTKDTYSTTDDFVTIRWAVLAKWISKVTVNDFTLSSFNWGTWRYHAATANNNLSVWTNIYEVKYFDEAGKLVYTNYFTIILKKSGTTSEEVAPN